MRMRNSTFILLSSEEAAGNVAKMNVSNMFFFVAFMLGVALICLLAVVAYLYYADLQKKKRKQQDMGFLSVENAEVVDPLKRETHYLRSRIAPNGVNPNAMDYLIINDEGKNIYYRMFTIQTLPKKVRFAYTFSTLQNFTHRNCSSVTSSVFIIPETASATSRKLDRRAVILEGEEIDAQKHSDTNRARKIRQKYGETTAWAEAVEMGDVKFYRTGFLFAIRAESYMDLNKASEGFVTKALEMGIELVAAYGLQSETFVSNLPMNTPTGSGINFLEKKGIKFHPMDRASVATIYNHTQTDFMHRDGVPLGYNLQTGRPVLYNLYSEDHDGYTLVIAGKTGCGKSTVLKGLCSREQIEETRFCCIDSQARGTVGEYADAAINFNGINVPIQNKEGGVVLNFFEIKESNKFVTDSTSGKAGQEIQTLELANKVAEVINIIFYMIYKGRENQDFSQEKFIEEVITDCINGVYRDFGIYDGDVDSLYETGSILDKGALTSGKIRKHMPTISDFFKKVLIREITEEDDNKRAACKIIISAIKTYVKEVYYSGVTRHFFTREEYQNLPMKKDGKTRVWLNEATGKYEAVIENKGIRAYYDGQSTVAITNESPFTNFDISQLPEEEKKLARQICMSFINENFIKKNSENIKSSNRMVLIIDEAHEQFKQTNCRLAIENIVRTARKRNCGVILCTQQLVEFDHYEETRHILANATTKFVFKQDAGSKDYLKKVLELTDTEVNEILKLGGNGDMSDMNDKNVRRGEMCIVDNRKVTFCQVEYNYFKSSEARIVETSAKEVEKIYRQMASKNSVAGV